MKVQLVPLAARRSGLDEDDAKQRSSRDERPAHLSGHAPVAEQSKERRNYQNGCQHASSRVQGNDHRIEDVGLGKCVEVTRGDGQKNDEPRQNLTRFV